MFRLAALALALVPTVAHAADQFDLACTGTRQGAPDKPPVPHQFGFRIDTAKKLWCWTRCDRTQVLQEVFPDRLVLRDRSEKSHSRDDLSRLVIDRTSGRAQQTWIQLRPVPTSLKVDGQCEVRPFSGFPTAKF